MWRQPPIWEPQGTKFRPYSITTLIFFYIGRFLVVCFAVIADCGLRIY
jgi:hypothetical protein